MLLIILNIDFKSQLKINKKHLTTPVIKPTTSSKKSVSTPSDHIRNNTKSHSIKEIKRSPIKPYVLNVRKCDVIRYEAKKQKYNNDTSGKIDLKSLTKDNHSIMVTRNVTKEFKTVADLPKSVKTYHRYNYNYNPNISNTGTHSIDATHKRVKKEVATVPRKNEVIKSTRPHRKNNSVIDIYGESLKNLRNINNIVEIKRLKNK